jgi:hypothetical protein
MNRRTTKGFGARWLSSMVVASIIVAATATGGLALALSPTTAAGADVPGDCTTTTGVIVAVDFAPWGGNVMRGCDPTLTTGYAALQAAGFTTVGDAHDGPAFICRINGDPTELQDPCINTPPATAYWSYWHADAGQNTWSYSQEGAATYQPPAGSVDAWVYGSTAAGGTAGEPSFPPSSVRATNTSVIPPSPSPTAPSPSPSSPPASSNTPAKAVTPPEKSTAPKGAAAAVPESHPGGSSSAGPAPTVNATTAAPWPTTTATWPTTTTTTINWSALSALNAAASRPSGQSNRSGSTPKIVDAAPAANDHLTSGSPAPLIEGVGVVVALTTVGYIVAWRRRRPG